MSVYSRAVQAVAVGGVRAVEGWLARRSCDELLLVIGDAVRRRAELAGALSRMGLPISSSEASSYNGIRALAELSLRVHGCGEFKKWFVRVAALLVRDNHDVEAALASGLGDDAKVAALFVISPSMDDDYLLQLAYDAAYEPLRARGLPSEGLQALTDVAAAIARAALEGFRGDYEDVAYIYRASRFFSRHAAIALYAELSRGGIAPPVANAVSTLIATKPHLPTEAALRELWQQRVGSPEEGLEGKGIGGCGRSISLAASTLGRDVGEAMIALASAKAACAGEVLRMDEDVMRIINGVVRGEVSTGDVEDALSNAMKYADEVASALLEFLKAGVSTHLGEAAWLLSLSDAAALAREVAMRAAVLHVMSKYALPAMEARLPRDEAMSAINIAYRELSTTSVNANARAILQLLARAQEALQNAY